MVSGEGDGLGAGEGDVVAAEEVGDVLAVEGCVSGWDLEGDVAEGDGR